MLKASGMTRKELGLDVIKINDFLNERVAPGNDIGRIVSGSLSASLFSTCLISVPIGPKSQRSPMRDKPNYKNVVNYGMRETIVYLASLQPTCYSAVGTSLRGYQIHIHFDFISRRVKSSWQSKGVCHRLTVSWLAI